MTYFVNSKEHILAELGRLDLLLRVQVWRARQLQPEQGNLQPYFVSEEEIDALLEAATGHPLWANVPLPEEALATIQENLDQMATDLERLKANSRRQGVALRLDSLTALFQYHCH